MFFVQSEAIASCNSWKHSIVLQKRASHHRQDHKNHHNQKVFFFIYYLIFGFIVNIIPSGTPCFFLLFKLIIVEEGINDFYVARLFALKTSVLPPLWGLVLLSFQMDFCWENAYISSYSTMSSYANSSSVFAVALRTMHFFSYFDIFLASSHGYERSKKLIKGRVFKSISWIALTLGYHDVGKFLIVLFTKPTFS